MDNNNNINQQQPQHDDEIQGLARALHAGDLARVQAAPPELLDRKSVV